MIKHQMCESEVLLNMMDIKSSILKLLFAKKYFMHNNAYSFSFDSFYQVTTQLILIKFKCLFTFMLLSLSASFRTHLHTVTRLWSLSFSGSCDLTLRPCCVCSIAGECMNHTLKTKTEGNKAKSIFIDSHQIS